MTVWVVLHEEYEWSSIRGVYATKEAAEEAVVTMTPSGNPSRSVLAHTHDCCTVEEHEVQE